MGRHERPGKMLAFAMNRKCKSILNSVAVRTVSGERASVMGKLERPKTVAWFYWPVWNPLLGTGIGFP
jgi:hypothetical protein